MPKAHGITPQAVSPPVKDRCEGVFSENQVIHSSIAGLCTSGRGQKIESVSLPVEARSFLSFSTREARL